MPSLLDKAEPPAFDGAQFEEQFPADLAVGFDEFEADPPSAALEPAPTAKRIGSKLAPPASGPVPAAVRRRIAAEIQLYIELLAGVAELRCPDCAAAVEAHAKKIAERSANILARYPDLAAKFISSTVIADLLGLAAALRPVAKQIIGHHVTHTIGTDEEGAEGDTAAGYDQYTAPTLRH